MSLGLNAIRAGVTSSRVPLESVKRAGSQHCVPPSRLCTRGGDVLHLLGDNGLGEAAFKPEIERLTAVPFLTLDATTFLELANSRCVPLGGSDILPFGICSLDRVL